MKLHEFIDLNSDHRDGDLFEIEIFEEKGLFIHTLDSDLAIDRYGDKTLLEWSYYDDCIHVKIK